MVNDFIDDSPEPSEEEKKKAEQKPLLGTDETQIIDNPPRPRSSTSNRSYENHNDSTVSDNYPFFSPPQFEGEGSDSKTGNGPKKPATRTPSLDDSSYMVSSPEVFNNGDVALLEPGMVLGGQYRIVALAGLGRMGQVWEAVDLIGNRTVALKLISREGVFSEVEVKRFKQSFMMIHALSHQYICPVYALVFDKRVNLYLVMKWMPETLCDYIFELTEHGHKRMDREMVFRILSNLAEALDYAHSHGVIHRDIKPTNIGISRNSNHEFECANLIDFGLSATFSTTSIRNDSRLNTAEICLTSGTPTYMSPEQWTGSPQEAQADQYSLAVVAYELLSGHLPFSSNNIDILRTCVLNNEPERIEGLSAVANAALMRALSKNKKKRFNSCREFVEALQGKAVIRRRKRLFWTALAGLLILLGFRLILNYLMPNTIDNRYTVVLPGTDELVYENPFDVSKVAWGPEISLEQLVERITPPPFTEPAKPAVPAVPEFSAKWGIGSSVFTDEKADNSGEGWSYRFDAENNAGELTLSDYSGGAIFADGFDLNVLIASGTVNVVQAERGDALSVAGGTLEVRGQGVKTTLELISKDERGGRGAAVYSPGKSASFRHLTRLTVRSGAGEGVTVAGGNLSVEGVQNWSVENAEGKDSLLVFGDIDWVGEADDAYEFSGGLWHSGKLSIFTDSERARENSHTPFTIRVAGVTVNYFVDTLKELADAFYDNSTEKIGVAVTGNIETAEYRHAVYGDTETLFVPFVTIHMLSTGDWTIRRGADLSGGKEMFRVNGTLTVGTEKKSGSSRLTFDGGAQWSFDPDASWEPTDTALDIGFGRINLTKRLIQSCANKSEKKNNRALMFVCGKLTFFEGVTVQNNENLTPYSSIKTAEMGGGINVGERGEFYLDGGEIDHCSAQQGGGVYVADGKFVFSGGSIRNNFAFSEVTGGSGAGVFISNGQFQMTGGELVGNLSEGHVRGEVGDLSGKGGAIHLGPNSNAMISGGEIAYNVSRCAGGGLYVGGTGSAFLNVAGPVKIHGNLATYGGGLYLNAGTSLLDGEIYDNVLMNFISYGTAISDEAAILRGNAIFLSDVTSSRGTSIPYLQFSEKLRIDQNNDVTVFNNLLPDALKSETNRLFIPLNYIGEQPNTNQPFEINFCYIYKNKDTLITNSAELAGVKAVTLPRPMTNPSDWATIGTVGTCRDGKFELMNRDENGMSFLVLNPRKE